MRRNTLTYKTVEVGALEQAYQMSYNGFMLDKADLPEFLFGDAMRLK